MKQGFGKIIMKKVLAVVLGVAMLVMMSVNLIGCELYQKLNKDNIRIGFIFLNDENSGYDKNFMDAVRSVQKELGLKDSQIIFKTGVAEDYNCYEVAMELANQGCNIVFANSFSHEDFMLQAATMFPDVEFCHASGTKAHTAGINNFHNAFASIYEGRYLTGIAAGMKLKEMIEDGLITESQAVLGYVGAFPSYEVKSGYTAFYLGAKSVCPSVTMKVNFTGAWYDKNKEEKNARALIALGAKLISQHADSEGAPIACEDNNIPNISYNGSMIDSYPETHMVSSKINWAPYFKYIIECKLKGEKISTDWTGTIATGSVELTEINSKVAASGTVEAISAAKEKFLRGSLKVFDTATFTVKGEQITSHLADVNTDNNFTPDTEVIKNGIFEESKYRSAPYFDLDIDGIEIVV